MSLSMAAAGPPAARAAWRRSNAAGSSFGVAGASASVIGAGSGVGYFYGTGSPLAASRWARRRKRRPRENFPRLQLPQGAPYLIFTSIRVLAARPIQAGEHLIQSG